MFRKYADSQSSHFTRRLAIRLSTILFDAYQLIEKYRESDTKTKDRLLTYLHKINNQEDEETDN